MAASMVDGVPPSVGCRRQHVGEGDLGPVVECRLRGASQEEVRLPIVRNPPVPSAFSDRTASTGSCLTTRVLAQANGSVRVEENTTLDISVSCAKPSSSDVAAKPDINW